MDKTIKTLGTAATAATIAAGASGCLVPGQRGLTDSPAALPFQALANQEALEHPPIISPALQKHLDNLPQTPSEQIEGAVQLISHEKEGKIR